MRGPPESFLLGPDGTVLFKIVGQVDAAGLNRLHQPGDQMKRWLPWLVLLLVVVGALLVRHAR